VCYIRGVVIGVASLGTLTSNQVYTMVVAGKGSVFIYLKLIIIIIIIIINIEHLPVQVQTTELNELVHTDSINHVINI